MYNDVFVMWQQPFLYIIFALIAEVRRRNEEKEEK